MAEETAPEEPTQEPYSPEEIRLRMNENQRQREIAEEEAGDAGAGNAAGRQSRIGTAEGMFMVAVSLGFDGSQFIAELMGIGVVVNPAIGVVSGLTFWLWLGHKGITYGSAVSEGMSGLKNGALVNAATMFIGVIPFVNDLPERTVGTIAIIVAERARSLAPGKSAASA